MMARIDYIKTRLANWSAWVLSQGSGGMGYPSRSAFLREVSSGGFREATIPVIETDAQEMQQAIDQLKRVHPELHETIWLLYVKAQSYSQCARHMGCVLRTVHNRLDQADAWLDRWLADKANRLATERQRKANLLIV
jgi:hypothetical protein